MLAALLCGFVGVAPANAQTVALASVAKQLGYSYTWVGTQDAVELTRGTMTVVIRPGQSLFDVNERTETTAVAPYRSHNEVYVSEQMAAQLAAIAKTVEPSSAAGAHAMAAPATFTGSIVLDTVHQMNGTYQLSVSGSAPAGAPVTVTETATFSREIPNVTLQVTHVAADSSGRFATTLPAAPGYLRGSIITVRASSQPGVAVASTQLVLKAPNEGVSVPVEALPRSVQ